MSSRFTYRDENGNARIFHETLRRNVAELREKLCHYEDLEEAGRLIELDDSLPARDELDRCTHRHCNNCDKYRQELQKYKDLEDIIGTTVWLCYKAWDGEIIFGEGKVILALLDKDGIILQVERRTGKYTRTHYNYGLNEFGRDMYRTKEEAESKLAELKG